jgi:putative transposase
VRQIGSLYKRHRFPGAIISHAVWLYYRFLLSYRDVEELLAERGLAVSYETVRRWCVKFGPPFADGVRRRRPRPGDKWHLAEVQLKINGRKHWLWRAVDQDGVVLDILVQARRNQAAAETFLRRLVEGSGYEPRVVITDKLASYPPALRQVLPRTEHRRHKGLNNRAEVAWSQRTTFA